MQILILQPIRIVYLPNNIRPKRADKKFENENNKKIEVF